MIAMTSEPGMLAETTITETVVEVVTGEQAAPLVAQPQKAAPRSADYGVRIAKQLVAFIEAKRCTTKLGAKHLRQVEMYAVNEGVEWMILTNGQVWQVWYLTAGLPVVLDLALEVDLLGEGGPAQKADTLFYLSKEAFRRHVIDDLWKVKAATSAKSLAGVITGATVVEQIRKELRRQTGHHIEAKELRELILAGVIRADAL
jgi:hypothetical protein